MPEDVDLPKMPRQWIINVCAAVIGTPFKNWVWDKIEEHNMNVQQKDKGQIALSRKVKERLEGCTFVSSKYAQPALNILFDTYLVFIYFAIEEKGSAVNMLKVGRARRRTVKQIQAEKEAAANKERLINEKLAMFDRMEERVRQLEQQDNDKNAAQNLMRQLIHAGIVEQDTDHSILVNS